MELSIQWQYLSVYIVIFVPLSCSNVPLVIIIIILPSNESFIPALTIGNRYL